MSGDLQIGGCGLHPLICHHDVTHLPPQPQRQDKNLQETVDLHEQRCVMYVELSHFVVGGTSK